MTKQVTATYSDLDRLQSRVPDAVRAQLAEDGPGQAVDHGSVLGSPKLVVEVPLDELRGQGRLVFTNVPGGRFRLHRLR